MNWTDEEIDKLFQESASQMNVPYQESFWSEMEALLPQKEKKKGLGWIFGGTLTCFALIAAMVFPGNQFSEGKTSNAPVAAKNAQPLAPNAKIALATGTQPTSLQTASVDNANVQNLGSGIAGIDRSTPAKPTETRNLAVNSAETTNEIASPNDDLTPEAAETSERLPLLALDANAPQLVPFANNFTPKAKNKALYLQVGFGTAQSYISGADRNWMTALNVGAGYQYKPQGFGFSAGVNISSLFASSLEITRKSKVYNFSSTNYQQNLTYKQLYSIELPVSVDFRKDRHTISLGVAPTYLATTVMRFSQLENETLSVNGIYVGQKAGLNSFGLKTGIGYQLEVAKSWNVGVQLNAQMIKQVDETQFVGDLTKIPLSGQITIRKTLTR